MNTCKTCKHWQLTEDDNHNAQDLARPINPVTFKSRTDDELRNDYGYLVRLCNHPKVVFYQRPQRDGAAVVDGSEYYASLLTAEDFGCVLHEGVR